PEKSVNVTMTNVTPAEKLLQERGSLGPQCCDIVKHKDSFLCCILSVRIQTFRTTPQKTKTCRMALPGRARGTERLLDRGSRMEFTSVSKALGRIAMGSANWNGICPFAPSKIGRASCREKEERT